MSECKCIKELKWFLIDDSFGENHEIKGGEYTFKEGSEYNFHIEESWYGRSFVISNGNNKPIVIFGKERFSKHFKIIK